MNLKLFLLSFSTVLISGCVGLVGEEFLWEDARQIQPGMTSIQAMRILGGPSKIIPGENRSSTWLWEHIEYGPFKTIQRSFWVVMDKDHRVVKVPNLSDEQYEDRLFETLRP